MSYRFGPVRPKRPGAALRAHGIQLLRVQHDQQAVLEFVGAGKQGSAALVQDRRVGFMIGRGDGQHLADRIHQQTEDSAGALQNQKILPALFGRHTQQLAQAHGGQHIAAIVHQPADKDRRQRNRLRTRRADNLQDVSDGHAEKALPRRTVHISTRDAAAAFSLRLIGTVDVSAAATVLMPLSPQSGSIQRMPVRRRAAGPRRPGQPRRLRDS